MPEDNENINAGTTSVTTVETESIDDILGIPGAENVMTTDDKKPNLFSRTPSADTTFLDNPDNDNEEKLDENGKPIISTAAAAAVLDEITNPGDDDDTDDEKSNAGRPKTNKDALIEFTKKWIAEKKLKPFTNDKDEEEDLTKYTPKDFEELFEANINQMKNDAQKESWNEFFSSLPDEMKALHKYVADGGRDMKLIFSALASVEATKDLDITNENDQEQIARHYLRATSPGLDEEDIDEQINTWKDRDELEAKVSKFKPKLEQLEQQRVAQEIQRQEELRKKQQERAAQYQDTVYKVLEPGELNGIKLDKKTQSMLYAGLIQPNYPSISGKPTNLLGHLLEKHQFVEPNHGLIAETLWLLADPEGYKNKIREAVKKETHEETVRKLKDVEHDKRGSGTGTNDDDDNGTRKSSNAQGLKRNAQNFFRRA